MDKSNLQITFLIMSIFGVLSFLFYKKYYLKPYQLSSTFVAEGVQLNIQQVLDKALCQKFQFIELKFKGQQGENLRVVTKCTADKINSASESFIIPFKHMFSFAPQSAEFTTQADTRIYLSEHKKKWSDEWKLETFRFFNSESDHFDISGNGIVLHLENLTKVSMKAN